MSKRKLSEYAEAADTGHSPSDAHLHKHARRAGRLQQTLEGSTKTLSGALKTGRGFERQKLGRRQKTARQNGDQGQLTRLEEEVAALKALDISLAAQRHLYKQMLKTKRIAESPELQQLQVSDALRAPPRSTAEANVTARLYSSNPVKQVLPGIMSSIRRVLGIDEKQKQKHERADREKSARRNQDARPKEDLSGGELTDRRGGEDQRDSSNLGDSSDEGASDSDISGSASDSGNDHFNQSIARPSSASSVSEHSSESESEDSASSTSHAAPSRSKAKVKAKSVPIANPATTFLPTLMGGYWSGGESEVSDNDDDPARIEPRRKNRPGQQARRAIWEKKYGAGANHVKKQRQQSEQERKGRDSGWDPRRGATGEGDRRSKKWGSNKHEAVSSEKGTNKDQSRGRSGFGGGEKDRRRPPQSQQPKDTKPLHPSWEAAKKAKEQRHVGFQGKKVTFD